MSRYSDRERYFSELAETSSRFYIPFVRRFASIGPGTTVLEIGCGEGGNLAPFASEGCEVYGVDISAGKIDNARKFFSDRGLKGEFVCCNFLTESLPFEKADIVIVKDVIEHIEPGDKPIFMSGIRSCMKPGAIVFMGFPAWQMPFGGHQQICRSRVCSHLPWTHLLPAGLYRRYLKLFREDPGQIKELMSIKRSRMSVEGFEKLCRRSGFRTKERDLWLINPHYKVKFGLRPVRMPGFLAAIPWLRDFMATSCHYILQAD